jgi:hypothetical protein
MRSRSPPGGGVPGEAAAVRARCGDPRPGHSVGWRRRGARGHARLPASRRSSPPCCTASTGSPGSVVQGNDCRCEQPRDTGQPAASEQVLAPGKKSPLPLLARSSTLWTDDQVKGPMWRTKAGSSSRTNGARRPSANGDGGDAATTNRRSAGRSVVAGAELPAVRPGGESREAPAALGVDPTAGGSGASPRLSVEQAASSGSAPATSPSMTTAARAPSANGSNGGAHRQQTVQTAARAPLPNGSNGGSASPDPLRSWSEPTVPRQ